MAERISNELIVTDIMHRFNQSRGFPRRHAVLHIYEQPITEPPGTRWIFTRKMGQRREPLGEFSIFRMTESVFAEPPGGELPDGYTILRAMVESRVRFDKGDTVILSKETD